MKAVRVNQWGQPVQLEETGRPAPADDQVLVRVRASSVNPIDGLILGGMLGSMFTLPMTLGTDFAGEAVEVGKGVSHVRPGDAVYGMSLARGAFAEYVAVGGAGVARKPESLDYVQAAAVPLAGLTAWQTLFNLAKLQAGERALIHGAAGGIGIFAVQLAKGAGASVVADDRPEKARFLRELGADESIDASRLGEAIRDVDVVLDLVGNLGELCMAGLKRGGRYVTPAGQPSQEEAARRGVEAYGTFTQPTPEDLAALAQQIDAGKVKVFVSRTFPLEETQAALDYKQEADTFGKVGITVG